MEEFNYGIETSYLPEWDKWEAVRELVANAIDSGGNVSVELEGDNLIIQDDGTGMPLEALLIGFSQKENDEAIGKFGEGLKMAMLVLTRMGYRVEVYSGNLFFHNAKKPLGSKELFLVMYEDGNSTFQQGRELFYVF